jgi:hypothetical protein
VKGAIDAAAPITKSSIFCVVRMRIRSECLSGFAEANQHRPPKGLSLLCCFGKVNFCTWREGRMAPRIVVGVFESEGIAEDACNRLQTEGVPATDILRKVLKEIAPPPETMEPELAAGFLGPFILGNFRESFARHIRNGETLVCVQASTDERVKMAVDVLKLYTPIEVKVVQASDNPLP